MLPYNCRYLCHIMLHCLSSQKVGWDDLPLHLSSAVLALALNRAFNFSSIILQEMRLVKGYTPSSLRPSYKNFRVSSNSSEEDEARRKGENDNYKEETIVFDDANYGHLSLDHLQEEATEVVEENVIADKNRGKSIMVEEEITQILETSVDDDNEEVNKELKEEYTRRNLLEMLAFIYKMQTAAILAEHVERERIEKMAKKVASWLASILELEEKVIKSEEETLGKKVIEGRKATYSRRSKKVQTLEKVQSLEPNQSNKSPEKV
ncbi:hypothetical protein L1987_27906 [Smallanthus sonchifolius]|uniref:Uncharacterized protein n=1 Tax=Smallanthus sonchifolius TaxID=185202 RepID=A0ACB9IBW8_9ASTR|nr:hypothetical protein L1987_27906 [Smallanthus sonchifolius]